MGVEGWDDSIEPWNIFREYLPAMLPSILLAGTPNVSRSSGGSLEKPVLD